jgi:hypothetical protein
MDHAPAALNLPTITLLDTPDDADHLNRFFDLMRGSVVVFATSSPDKRTKYKTLFNCFHPHEDGSAGINAYFTDIGSLNIPPKRTPERAGSYQQHTVEKALSALNNIMDHEASIRGSLIEDVPQDRPIITMVEDSGWELTFDHYEHPLEVKKQFLHHIRNALEERFREEDYTWIFNHIKPNDPESSFPGPNVKPIQEALPAKFNDLMQLIYEAADRTDGMGADSLRYKCTIDFGFAVQYPDGGQELFVKDFAATGVVITPQQFTQLKEHLPLESALCSNAVHIPDGQIGEPQTLEALADTRLRASSDEAPFDYVYRNFAEWLQAEDHVGPKPDAPWQHQLHIAYVCAEDFEQGEMHSDALHHSTHIRDLMDAQCEIIGIPTRPSLRLNPYQRVLNGTDIIILRGSEEQRSPEGLVYDPNLMLVDYMVVNTEIDPLSMTTPIILDNRDGAFDRTLRIYRDAYQSGRFMGELPFIVAHDDASLSRIVEEQRRMIGASKIVHTPPQAYPEDHEPTMVDSNILYDAQTIFIAGGHSNNSKQDRAEACTLGYELAKEGLRIVTGGGQVEGSMGSIHTGFVQYHLDCAMRDGFPRDLLEDVAPALYFDTHQQQQRLNAELLIEEHPEIINKIADRGFIPRDMFYAFSTEPIIKMESPNGMPTVGAHYVDTINRIRRLDALMMPRTMIFMPGAIGTDEELVHALKENIAWHRLQPANDEPARSGAATTLILYNRTIRDAGEEKGQIDGLLEELNIYKRDDTGALIPNEEVCIASNIEVIRTADTQKQTIQHLMDTTHASVAEKKTWTQRINDASTLPQPRRAFG